METRLTTKEVAKLYNKNESTIRRWAESGKLDAERVYNEFNSPAYLFAISVLDKPIQEKYFAQAKASLPKTAISASKKDKPFDHYTDEERQEIIWWQKTLEDWKSSRIKERMDWLKGYFETLAADDLKDTKLLTASYWGSQNSRVTVTNAATVKPVSLTMVKEVLGSVAGDFIKTETTDTMTAPCKKLLGMVAQGNYTEGTLDSLIQKISSDPKVQATLQKRLTPPPRRKPKTHTERPGGATAAQQRKVWALLYELQKADTAPSRATRAAPVRHTQKGTAHRRPAQGAFCLDRLPDLQPAH